jgi:hypothetical protein
MNHTCLSIWCYQDSEEIKALSSSFAGRQPAADGGLWHHTLACGLFFRAREKAVSCKEPSTLQVFDLFISKSSIGAFAANEVRQDLIYQLQVP